jgi:hypothetical protein
MKKVIFLFFVVEKGDETSVRPIKDTTDTYVLQATSRLSSEFQRRYLEHSRFIACQHERAS